MVGSASFSFAMITVLLFPFPRSHFSSGQRDYLIAGPRCQKRERKIEILGTSLNVRNIIIRNQIRRLSFERRKALILYLRECVAASFSSRLLAYGRLRILVPGYDYTREKHCWWIREKEREREKEGSDALLSTCEGVSNLTTRLSRFAMWLQDEPPDSPNSRDLCGLFTARRVVLASR